MSFSASDGTAGAVSSFSISVVGDHLVNENGQVVHLVGVNVQSTEYDCEQGPKYSIYRRVLQVLHLSRKKFQGWGKCRSYSAK